MDMLPLLHLPLAPQVQSEKEREQEKIIIYATDISIIKEIKGDVKNQP